MIDIVDEKNHNLKNVTQIGTPSEEEKIYIEDSAYARMHMDELWERCVFVLMGHTECASGIYTTFIESVIPVQEIGFEKNTPIWTNQAWSSVFREIKRAYESLIVVGWALDLKGIAPRITPELEAIHREHFGGVHQLFFLANTADGEEYFYLNKNNHLYQKNGFYIYYSAGKTRVPQPGTEVSIPFRPRETMGRSAGIRNMNAGHPPVQEKIVSFPKKYSGAAASGTGRSAGGTYSKDSAERPQGHYREMLLSRQPVQEAQKSSLSVGAVALAAVLLAAIIGTAISKNPQQAAKIQKVISTISDSVRGKNAGGDGIIQFTTEQFEESETSGPVTENGTDPAPADSAGSEQAGGTEHTETTEEAAETFYIPVEKVDGGIPAEK